LIGCKFRRRKAWWPVTLTRTEKVSPQIHTWTCTLKKRAAMPSKVFLPPSFLVVRQVLVE
jgi:hypothetical protein